MNELPGEFAELAEVLAALRDGGITDVQMAWLDRQIVARPKAKQFYLAYVDLWATLGHYQGVSPQAEKGGAVRPQRASASLPPRSSRPLWRHFLPFVGVAAALLVFVAAVVLGTRREGPVAAAPNPVVAAKLSATRDAVWSDPDLELLLSSGEMPPGPLRLSSGVCEFAFANGASATIEGPAVFEVLGADRLSVQKGKVLCRCPDEASRLTVLTPNAQVIDLGTEFVVAVESEDRTRVAVIQGEVRFTTKSNSLLLKTGQAGMTDPAGRIGPDHSALEHPLWLIPIVSEKIPDLSGQPNLLADPGFESDIRPETEPAKGSSQPWVASRRNRGRELDRGRHGTQAASIRSLGSPYWPYIGQDVKIADLSGRLVVASVWAMHPHDDPLSQGQNAFVKIIFLNASGREFAVAFRHFLSAGEGTDQYVWGRVAAVAPAGAVAVRFQVLLNARGLRTGMVFFDDATLNIVSKD